MLTLACHLITDLCFLVIRLRLFKMHTGYFAKEITENWSNESFYF